MDYYKKTVLVLVAFLTISLSTTAGMAFELDPVGGGNGFEVKTTWKAYVRDTQSGTGMAGVSVELKRGSQTLESGVTDQNGYHTFAQVTDGGTTDYHIIVSTDKATPGYVDRNVRSASFEGSFRYTEYFNLNRINKYAVIVGIADWSHPEFGDTSGNRDANNWYAYTTQLGFNHIVTLGDTTSSYSDQNKITATKSNIKDAVQNVVDEADSNDVAVFVVAAHHNLLGYVACYDSNYWLLTSWLSGQWLCSHISSCGAGRILVWYHMCHAEGSLPVSPTANSLWMGSCKIAQVSFNDNFRRDFVNSTSQLGGIDQNSLEAIFNDLIQYYPKKTSDGKKEMMPVMYDGNKNAPFVLY